MRRAALLSLLAMVLAACGSHSHAQALRSACPSRPARLVHVPALPAHFPTLKGMTLSAVQTRGSTTIVQGYLASGLAAAHAASGASLDGYRVTSDRARTGERDITFSGLGRHGQLKLVQACANLTSVTITLSPH